MDKKALQEQFEAIAIQNCWNINKYPAGWDDHGDDEYADVFVDGAWWAWQHQQAKVEELQKRVDVLEKLRNTYRAIADKELDNCTEGLLKHIERLEKFEQAFKGEG
ncbi:hypothetical protein [Acinetobacter lactucae]|uniref:hypothetical protein n=1 Tax=Acinetobacter lactucae TaxID=1785128 RepID=UPI001580C97E|nr:hypothetical protein [Acinetobacter lactucae]NUG49679.1 hypothetical protein [Acinetobacter lactucae]